MSQNLIDHITLIERNFLTFSSIKAGALEYSLINCIKFDNIYTDYWKIMQLELNKETAVMVNPVGSVGSGSASGGLSLQALQSQFESILQSFQQQFNQAKASNGAIGSGVDALLQGGDLNNDQKLNASELAAALKITPEAAQNFVNFFDTNSDKAVDKTELTNALTSLEQAAKAQEGGAAENGGKEEAGGAEEAGGGKPAETGGGESAPSASGLLELLTKLLDKDGDGKVSPEELKEFVDKYDKNGDGKLDKAELKEGLKAEAEAQGVELPEDQIDALVDEIDTNKDGALDGVELLYAINEKSGAESDQG